MLQREINLPQCSILTITDNLASTGTVNYSTVHTRLIRSSWATFFQNLGRIRKVSIIGTHRPPHGNLIYNTSYSSYYVTK